MKCVRRMCRNKYKYMTLVKESDSRTTTNIIRTEELSSITIITTSGVILKSFKI